MFEPSPQPRPQLASHDLVGKLRLQLLAATQTAAATATSADRFLAFGFSSFGWLLLFRGFICVWSGIFSGQLGLLFKGKIRNLKGTLYSQLSRRHELKFQQGHQIYLHGSYFWNFPSAVINVTYIFKVHYFQGKEIKGIMVRTLLILRDILALPLFKYLIGQNYMIWNNIKHIKMIKPIIIYMFCNL